MPDAPADTPHPTAPELAVLRPIRVLEAALERDRFPHALLLQGPSLDSLEAAAGHLSARLLGTDRPDRHPDAFALRPAKKMRQIRIGEAHGEAEPNTLRWLLKQLAQSAHQGGRKVAVVHEADRMNAATANAFLKTLEEPPPDTVLLLLTTRPYDLLPTLRSRCFLIRLPATGAAVRYEAWQAWLEAYGDWVTTLFGGADRAGTSALLQGYALIARFEATLGELADAAWKAQKADLPDHWDDDERNAFEVGLKKGLRDQLCGDLSAATRAAVLTHRDDLSARVIPLGRALDALEQATALFAANLKESVALERFFLVLLQVAREAR